MLGRLLDDGRGIYATLRVNGVQVVPMDIRLIHLFCVERFQHGVLVLRPLLDDLDRPEQVLFRAGLLRTQLGEHRRCFQLRVSGRSRFDLRSRRLGIISDIGCGRDRRIIHPCGVRIERVLIDRWCFFEDALVLAYLIVHLLHESVRAGL